jgi:hypothetical protein
VAVREGSPARIASHPRLEREVREQAARAFALLERGLGGELGPAA